MCTDKKEIEEWQQHTVSSFYMYHKYNKDTAVYTMRPNNLDYYFRL